jgi:predicted HTH domain antitoxin
MTYTPLSESVELYQTTEQSLTQIASQAGVSKDELASKLRSKGVALRSEDEDVVTATRY